MNLFITRALVVVSAICLFFVPQRSSALDQPDMRDAIALLRQAKTSDDALPLLQKAWKELKDAAHDKGGYRIRAMQEVREAIDAQKAGDKQQMLDKIDHAISEIWTGIGHGERNEN